MQTPKPPAVMTKAARKLRATSSGGSAHVKVRRLLEYSGKPPMGIEPTILRSTERLLESHYCLKMPSRRAS
eukprot:5026292-Amphidinium_carterae.1